MPFTAGHPAAVLPLLRLGLVPSALVIGSMVPDLPYFVPMPLGADVTHSARGAVGVDVCLGLAGFVLWQALLAPAAVALAPARLRERLPRTSPGGLRAHLRAPRDAALLLLSLATGAFTHVVWDSFTHPARWGQQHVGWLSSAHGSLQGYQWAQYASGLLGMAALVAWCALWWRRTPPAEHEHPRLSGATRLACAGAILTAGVVGALVGGVGPLLQHPVDLRDAAFLAVTRGGALAGVTALGVAFTVLRLTRGHVRVRSD